jgi:hypothetical protein
LRSCIFVSPSADAPYREPQIASSSKLVALTFGSANSIYVQTSTNQGESFSAPVKVSQMNVLPLSRHRGPHIAISESTLIVTAVAGNAEATGSHAHGLASDGDLYAWRSTDGGKSWSKGARINEVAASAREGLHALAADGGGNIFAVWLDLRDGGTELYGSLSRDSGATWSANVPVYKSPDGHICECCHPSAAYSNDGTLDVMWRNCLGGSRDLYIAHSRDGRTFGQPEKLGLGTWKMDACPMDGGGLTHSKGKAITAWRREADLFLAEPGKAETKIGRGRDIAVAANMDKVYALWIEDSQLKLWVNGKTEILAESAAFPSVKTLPGGGAVAAWEQDGESQSSGCHEGRCSGYHLAARETGKLIFQHRKARISSLRRASPCQAHLSVFLPIKAESPPAALVLECKGHAAGGHVRKTGLAESPRFVHDRKYLAVAR